MPTRSPHPDVHVPAVTLTDYVLGGAAERGERPAIVDAISGSVLTYARLAEDVDRCAAGLAARGLVPGEVVGIFAPNVPECGAAPLDAELQREAERRVGCRVQQGYGLTEASPVTHHVHQDDENVHGTIGTLFPSTEARLVDAESGEDAAPGEPGEIWVRGPQVMLGYLGDEAATAATLTSDGWLRTGDIATIDEAGRFRVVDRLKELIKYKGYQVPPAQLEGILLTHPQIADACVVPVRDEEAGEVPKAFVVPREGQVLDPFEVFAFVAGRVAPHMQVRACELIDAIPKSPSGKLLRRVLVEREREARR